MARTFSEMARSSKIYDLAILQNEQATLGNMWGATQKGNPFFFEEKWQGHLFGGKDIQKMWHVHFFGGTDIKK